MRGGPLLLALATLVAAPAPDAPPAFLSYVNGARAMGWVHSQTSRTLGILRHDPHFDGFHRQAPELGQTQDRIPKPEWIGGSVYNFWQDRTHVRGIWRRTGLASYRSATPDWHTVIDLDALSRSEHANWVWKGTDCEAPEERLCLVTLSDVGEDADTQREFDDFAAVGRDLIARRITSVRRPGIRGGSNGGLLMGVEFTQHPELWHAAIIEVPLLDMLNFETLSAGASWVGEYGSVSNPGERAFLAGISPLRNLRAGVAYPEPFIFTTTKDDRVGPVHARRFAWRMQQLRLPFLYCEETEGGHAAGANLREVADEQALEFTYLTRKLME